MYKHQDPLNKAYTQLIRESGHEDYRQAERNKEGHAKNLIKAPGIHVFEFDEIKLNNGTIIPAEVEFTTEWGNEDYESPEGRGRIKTHDAGFTTNINKVYIPSIFPESTLDEITGQPGVYKPGMDLLPLLSDEEVQYINDSLTEQFNDRTGWGQTSHYLPDSQDQ